MSITICGLGTATPSTALNQEESRQLVIALGNPTKEQIARLPDIYAGTGIQTRHVSVTRQVILDILQGTEKSGSPFLPTGQPDDRGPTTGQRMTHYAAEAGPLAVRAARAALEQAQIPPDRPTHLVTVSCTGFCAPGVDTELIREIPLPRSIERTHIGFMGCQGALNGLRVAGALTTAYPDACVLLCAVELCSIHYHYGLL